MIKVYCDECGKEITGNINKEIEEIEAIDINGDVVTKFTKIFHCCDECQCNDLTCGFKVGDQVVASDGRVGTITGFCDCEGCERRGFYEPQVRLELGVCQIYITDSDKRDGFMRFYQIGDQVFGNLDEQWLRDYIKGKKEDIHNMKKSLIQLEAQLDVVKSCQKSKEKELEITRHI